MTKEVIENTFSVFNLLYYNIIVILYQNLRSALLNPCSDFKLILLEISSLGFTGSSIKTFETYLNGKKLGFCKNYQKVSRSDNTCFILYLLLMQ